jgi:hypothetical protein
MMPEQIVGHEDVVSDRRQIPADRIDRALPHGARVQLPDRTERTAERTSARGFDQPHRTMGQARILTAPRAHVLPGGQRHAVERQRSRLTFSAQRPTLAVTERETGHIPEGCAPLEGVGHLRHHPLAIVHDDRRHVRHEERRGIGRSSMTTDHDRHVGGQPAHTTRERDHFIGFERVHGRDADEARA